MKIFKNCLQILISSIIIGYFLLSVSYNIPTSNMKSNIAKNINEFKKEEIYQKVDKHFNSGMLDNFTDSLMLLQASSDNDNAPYIASLENKRAYSNDIDIRDTIEKYINNEQLNTVNYSRYWHGYLIFLKPLLYMFDYFTIRSINLLLQSLLAIILIILLIKKINILFALSFIGSLFVLQPYITSLSLQFSSVYYIMLISSIFILIKDKIKIDNYIYIFLTIGILTSYFDLLTYPIVTFGIPAIIYITLNKKDINLIDFIKIGLAWISGYLGMWIGKWILTSLILNENIIKIALETIKFRTSSNISSQNISRIDTIISNYQYGLNNNVILINGLIFIVNLIIIFINKYQFNLNKKIVLPLVILIIAPAVWIFITANHANIHYFYTNKSIAISIFATYALIFNNYSVRRLTIKNQA